VAEDRVDEAADADAVEQVALEAGAPDHGTEVMVEQVSAKANWNRKNARKATPVVP